MMIHISEIEQILKRLENSLKDTFILLLMISLVGATAVFKFDCDKTYLLVPLLFDLIILSMMLQNCGLQIWLQRRIRENKTEDL